MMIKVTMYILMTSLGLMRGGLTYAQSFADQVKFVHVTTTEGLLQSSVFAITQDHKDLIWIGTRDGLNKYDSRRFIAYKNALSDSTSLSDSWVTTVLEDKNKRLWVGTRQGLNLYDRNFDRFIRIPLVGHGGSEPYIFAIEEDRAGNVWFCTRIGLFLLTPDEERLQPTLAFNGQNIPGRSLPRGARSVRHIYEDSRGRHWLSTASGVFAFEDLSELSNPKVVHDIRRGNHSLNSAIVNFVYEMKPGIFWIGTKAGGINVFDEKEGVFDYITSSGWATSKQRLSSNDVRSLTPDRHGGYWIGTINGLNYYDEERGFVSFFKNDHDAYALTDNSIRPIFQDRRGSIWVGTYYGGVSIFDRDLAGFQHYEKKGTFEHLSSNIVSSIVQDRSGDFWVGYEGGGLAYMTPDKGAHQHYMHIPGDPHSLRSDHVKQIYLDSQDNLWVGTYTGGLSLLRKDGQGFNHYRNDPNDMTSLSSNNVYAIAEDKEGNLWIGTHGGGLNVKKAGTEGYFESYHATNKEQYRLRSNLVRTIYIDSRENIWVATGDGLHVRWVDTDHFEAFIFDENNPHSISGNVILSIYEDKQKRLWIGTSNEGLNEFRYETKDFRRVGSADDLLGNKVVGIAEDGGMLWLSTNNGIYAFNPSTDEMVSYTTSDGLLGNEFSIGAVCRSQEGELLFGGTHGISAFYPREISRSNFQSKMIFSEVRMRNKRLSPESSQLSNQHISVAEKLTLSHDDNMVSVDFATLNYIRPEKNRYAYRLEGLEDEWNYVSTPTATYTNLNPGKYTLFVKGATNDGVWSEDIGKLPIVVLSPWWGTWWAYTIYGVSFVLLLYWVLRFFHARRELKYQLHVKQLEVNNSKKMADMKANFYTYISHELRTPLTLILGPVHQMLSEAQEDDVHRPILQVVRQNAQRLLRLVNELLDSRKNELGLVHLQVGEHQLPNLIQEVLHSFQEEIRSKNVSVDLQYDESLPAVWIDYGQMEKVFFNLLANALRFVPKGGKIWIHFSEMESVEKLGQKSIRVEIGDNGSGIRAEDLPFIFELFYQGKKQLTTRRRYGSGLGLVLTRDIVSLHGGSIRANSRHEEVSSDSFTSFVIEVRMGKVHFDLDKVSFVNDAKEEADAILPTAEYSSVLVDDILRDHQADEGIEKAVVLIVDDNEDILFFLQQQLAKHYTVVTAKGGEEAWEIVRDQLPDVVISDVRMPDMDGTSLTKLIKDNETTAHIPVVLLTALISDEDVLVGMVAGADDYLTKPVHVDLLMIKIQNILYTKKNARRWFIRQYMLTADEEQQDKLSEDQLFLNRVVNYIESSLSNEDLSVVQLSAELGMSRPVLYKRIKQLTGMSIIELMNMLRLRRATELFDGGALGISDIAYQVGYSDPKWFSKTFKSYYGVTPKQFSQMETTEKARLIDQHNLFHIFQDK